MMIVELLHFEAPITLNFTIFQVTFGGSCAPSTRLYTGVSAADEWRIIESMVSPAGWCLSQHLLGIRLHGNESATQRRHSPVSQTRSKPLQVVKAMLITSLFSMIRFEKSICKSLAANDKLTFKSNETPARVRGTPFGNAWLLIVPIFLLVWQESIEGITRF